ncbi:MAG: DUF6067 family protein [bacterium]|jgi:hypothetical protein|nr:DUF6067 family protein [bacterium]MDD3805462.1 DUF6067 family protein [bacterium]MDD4557740.1 DUF6067 family protein [bacterium]
MQRLKICAVFFLSSMIILSALAAAASADERIIGVPLVNALPVIDGTVDEKEWSHAAAICGFTQINGGTISDQATVAFMSYDRQGIYIAFRCYDNETIDLPPRNPWYDDNSVEVALRVPGGAVYRFIGMVNSKVITAGGTSGWSGRVSFAARRTDFGWEAEYMIPFDQLGGISVTSGDIWSFNLGRYCTKTQGKTRRYSLGAVKSHAIPDSSAFYRLLFTRSEGIRVLSLGDVRGGVLELSGKALVPVSLDIKLSKNEKTLFTKKVDLNAGDFEKIPAGDIPDFDRYNLNIIGKIGTREIFNYLQAVKKENRIFVRLTRCDEKEFQKTVDIWVPAAIKASKAKLSLAPVGSDKTVEEYIVPLTLKGDVYHGTGRLINAGCRPGKYHLFAGALDKQDRLLMQEKFSVSVANPDDWSGSRAGITDKVLPPYTPLLREGGALRVLNRSYAFADSGLPRSIKAAGKELLFAPVEMKISGVSSSDTVFARSVVMEKPERYIQLGKHNGGKLSCEIKTTLEYDGMSRYDVRLVPAGKGVPLQKLSLEIPFKAEHAGLLHYWPGASGSGELKAAWASAFKWILHLGDEERGLTWFMESDEAFNLLHTGRAIEIIPDGQRVLLRINIIDHPIALEGPVAFTFGLQATPLRKTTVAGWLEDRICHHAFYGMENKGYAQPGSLFKPSANESMLEAAEKNGYKTLVFHESWTEIQSYGDTAEEEGLKRLVKAVHDRKMKMMLYFGFELSDLAPEYAAYRNEVIRPNETVYARRVPSQKAYKACYNSIWSNFLVDAISKALKKYDVDGVYLDSTAVPFPCDKLIHGCGYVNDRGQLRQTAPIFAVREMMKRIYALNVAARADEAFVDVHQSGCLVTPVMAFASSYWDGEQIAGRLQSRGKVPFKNIMSLPAFRAEFMGKNIGLPAQLIAYNAREGMAISLLHDVTVRPQNVGSKWYGAIWKIFADFGAQSSRWIPYWLSGDYVAIEHPDAYASLYVKDSKVLMVLSNFGNPGEITVELKGKAYGFTPRRIHNVLTGAGATVSNNLFKTYLEEADFALFVIE